MTNEKSLEHESLKFTNNKQIPSSIDNTFLDGVDGAKWFYSIGSRVHFGCSGCAYFFFIPNSHSHLFNILDIHNV